MRWTCLITLATAALLGCGPAPSENRYAPALANIRGEAWSKAGEYDKAIAEYNEALRIAPLFETAYYNRGRAWYFKREYDKAIADFNETLRLNPSDDRALIARGDAWQAKGEYDKAISDYDEVVRIDPQYAPGYNNLAWLRATCPEAKYRDGKQAVEDATKACELTGWTNASCIDTLAVACAEAGDFEKAIQWQTKVIGMVPESEKAGYQKNLDLYLSGQPYREKK